MKKRNKPNLTLLDWSKYGQYAKYRVELCDLHQDAAHSWWFRIVRINNGQIIATSELYASKAKRDKSAQRLAEDAKWSVYEVTQ